MMDYEKLIEDLRTADSLASELIKGMDDGGSANLDSVFLKIPRLREKKVLEAIKSAGLYCRTKTEWIGKGYMITPNGVGQGDTRTKAVEVMKDKLNELGWDVIIFHKSD